jgi:hypothetical protein
MHPAHIATLFILAFTLMMCAVVTTRAAHAVEIPKQYRGAWCETEWQTIYKRCRSADFEVERTFWTTVESTCTVLSVRKSKYGGHSLLAKCAADEGSRDMPSHVEVRWWLGTNNTRLQTIQKDIDAAINVCDQRFQAGELQPGNEIGACYAKATNNTCEGGLDGSRAQACLDWVESRKLSPLPTKSANLHCQKKSEQASKIFEKQLTVWVRCLNRLGFRNPCGKYGDDSVKCE